ncbi:MAG: type I 3-dehydroquinate dehydratase [Lentisphaerae bacterium]|nr:type I 3-dehydroquinate dehydratase [Lentisphaerota bacterium]
MRPSFLRERFPVLTGIFSGQTPEALIAAARNAEALGARGVAAELWDLKPEFRNGEVLRQVVESVALPVMFTFYRNDIWCDSSDEERQKLLLEAASAGAAMIDVMGDLYDPSQHEITYCKSAIQRQIELIEEIHARGAEVVISSHTSAARSCSEVVAQLQAFEERGADVVKIVTHVSTGDELAEAFKTTIKLKEVLEKPFIHLCSGPLSRPHRFVGPTLGTAISFGVVAYSAEYLYPQPTITALKNAFEAINWQLSYDF